MDQHVRWLEHMPRELGFRRAGLAQPGEEMALEAPHRALATYGEKMEKMEPGFSWRCVEAGQKTTFKRQSFRLGRRRNVFPVRAVGWWLRSPKGGFHPWGISGHARSVSAGSPTDGIVLGRRPPQGPASPHYSNSRCA